VEFNAVYNTWRSKGYCAPTLHTIIPSINIHKLTQQKGISYGSAHRVLARHMHLQPYKTSSAHGLKEMDNIKDAENISSGFGTQLLPTQRIF
jgi:hypothetical protein